MQTGLDRLLKTEGPALRGKRIGLLAHAASLSKLYLHALDILQKENRASISVLLGPEHGFSGLAQDMEAVKEERYRGIPVHSLYGSRVDSLKPKAEWLQNLDLLICDLQDVGSRYYTFIYTVAFCLQVASQTQTPVLVLDRPNPIGGHATEGNIVQPGFFSFVGQYPLANRHGMTLGELSYYFRDTSATQVNLRVLPMKGWNRRRYFDELDLPWVMPSPNMPTVDTAVVYPGMCLLEGTELSEGRGTTRPFEIFGAPFIDPEKLQKRLKDFRLPGVKFRPLYFKPQFQKHAGKNCGGLQMHITRRKVFKPLLTGVAILKAIHELYPEEFQWRHRAYEFVDDIPAIDLLAGSALLRQQIETGASLQDIEASWENEQQNFLRLRKDYLLYT